MHHDRRWFVTSHERESTTLRCVDRGDTAGPMHHHQPAGQERRQQTTLEEFERDIRFALKENFGELVSSRQWTNSFGHHCLEVVVRGTTEEVPIEWHYYLVAPESRQPRLGRRHDPRRNGQPPRRRRPQLVNAIELLPGGTATETASKSETRR